MTYGDIIKRLEGAMGPDRELDWRIADALNIPSKWSDSTIWPPFMKGSAIDKEIPLFSSSIDASLALVERMLPDANCCGVEKDANGWNAYVSRNSVDTGHWLVEAATLTAPLAILLALFRALEAKEAA